MDPDRVQPADAFESQLIDERHDIACRIAKGFCGFASSRWRECRWPFCSLKKRVDQTGKALIKPIDLARTFRMPVVAVISCLVMATQSIVFCAEQPAAKPQLVIFSPRDGEALHMPNPHFAGSARKMQPLRIAV